MKKEKSMEKPSILVVDDDNSVLLSLREWLESEGFRTFTALNGKVALKIVEQERVEAALLDFRLGTDNGLSVARMLNAADENIKIIIITGYPSHEIAVESIKAGMFDYVSKDEPNDKILDAVRKAIHSRKKEFKEKGTTGSKSPHLKLAVVCNHSLIKERLGNFLSNQVSFRLMKTFDSLADLTGMEHVPEVDIALVCASCCGGSIESAAAFCDIFRKKLPGTKPVLFNQRFSDSDKVELIRKGVRGFFSIDMDSKRLEKALGVIKNGGIWTGPEGKDLPVPDENAENGLLSAREKETLEAMATGLKNKEIAAKLDISEVTVKSHINRIYKKFRVDNRARAILFAMENNLLEEGDKKED